MASPPILKWLFEDEALVLKVKLRIGFGFQFRWVVLGQGEDAADRNIATRVLTKIEAQTALGKISGSYKIKSVAVLLLCNPVIIMSQRTLM